MQGSIKSARRVFEVLELYAERRKPLSATDVGRELGYPHSSVAALLKCMMNMGYLTFDARQKRYLPSPRLAMLGSWIERSLFGRAEILDLLLELHDATGEIAVLSAQCDLRMVILHLVPAAAASPPNIARGRALPLFRSAVGLAQLSTMLDYEIEMLLDRSREHDPSVASPPTLGELRRTLTQVRSRGYACGYGLVEPNLGIVAMPIRSLLGGSQYVVSTGAPCKRMRGREADIARRMRDVIARLLDQRAGHVGKSA